MRKRASFVAVLIGICSAVANGDEAPGVYVASSPEPTAQETLMLEYINRCRANPVADGLRIMPPGKKSTSVNLAAVNREMFREEMSRLKPAAPLVFSLQLLKAARRHSYYQILNGKGGHEEVSGQRGFTGRSSIDRILAAGLRGVTDFSENVFYKATDPWDSHTSFVVDPGEGPGGMQPKREHREVILRPIHNLVGTGAVPHDGGRWLAVTHDFARVKGRFAGGVVYNDKNRNRFYDLGEGIRGIEISQNEKVTQTWKSGAYALPIDSGDIKLSVKLGERSYSKRYAPGNENIKFDFIIPSASELAAVDKLIRSTEAIKDVPTNAKRRFAALLKLHVESKKLWVDDKSMVKIESLTKGVVAQLESVMETVRKAVDSAELKEARKTIMEQREPYQRTVVATWFQEAYVCAAMKGNYDRFAKMKSDGKNVSEKLINRQLTTMKRNYDRMTTSEWKDYLKSLGNKLLELPKQ